MIEEEEKKDSNWLLPVLEEYKSLRSESLTSMQNQQSTLRFATAAIGAMFAFGIPHLGTTAGFIIFSTLIPLFSSTFYLIYAIEFGRMVRVGRYIEQIEKRINYKLEPNTVGWETWLSTQVKGKSPRLRFYYSVPSIFHCKYGFKLFRLLD